MAKKEEQQSQECLLGGFKNHEQEILEKLKNSQKWTMKVVTTEGACYFRLGTHRCLGLEPFGFSA
jgi:hypothetical protein